MENNEFGMEAIISNGLGFSDSLFNTKKTNFDGDFDSMSLEIASTENLVNFAETYNQLDAYNADQKIKMLKKLHIHTRNVPGSYGKSVENFIIEQSLEEAATKEAAGEKSGANPAKLPKDQIGKQRDGFIAKVWQTLKDLFFKIVDWFKGKLQWIADKIGKRPTTSESIQALSSCTSEEAKDIWDTLLENDIDASTKSSEQGKVICISANAINKFASNVEKFDMVGRRLIACAQTVEKQGGYLAANKDSNLSYNDIVANVNGIKAQIAEFIPGGKQVPETIQKLTKDEITKFNRQFKESLSYLQWDHDPEGYAKLFTGSNLIAKKAGGNAASVAAAQYGTTNPAQLRKLIPSLTESLKTIDTTLDKLKKDVDIADKAFNRYISHKDRNITDNNGNLKEYKGGDDNYANAIIIYQFATTTMTCFKMLNKLIKVAIDIHEKMNNELVKLTNVLDKAAKAKKERKWFQFKKKDRDAKKANDTLKEAGLDTENEEKVDKRNANWDKLENFEKGAKKTGNKIGKIGSAIKNKNPIAKAKAKKEAKAIAEQGKKDREELDEHFATMNERDYTDRVVDAIHKTRDLSINNDGWLGKNKKGEYASRKNNTDGQYTGWEKENIPKDEEGNYKKRKDIGSNESWLLNPEDYI